MTRTEQKAQPLNEIKDKDVFTIINAIYKTLR